MRKIGSFFLSGVYTVSVVLLPDLALANLWQARQQAVSNLGSVSSPSIESSASLNGPIYRPRQILSEKIRSASLGHGSLRSEKSPTTQKARVIVHIQDIHQNEEAQNNISEFIKALSSGEAINLLALEGAFEEADLSPFRRFRNQNSVRHVADYLFKNGKMSGAAFGALTAPLTIPHVSGIDDREWYVKNAAAVKNAWPQKEEAAKRVLRAQENLESEKRSFYSKSLIEVDRIAKGYRNGDLNLLDYLGSLKSWSEKTDGPGLSPSLIQYKEALTLEQSLEFSRVEAERTRFIEALLKKLPKGEVQTLMALTRAFKQGRATHSEFYRGIQAAGEKRGVSLDVYPLLRTYLVYLDQADQIDLEAVAADALTLEKKIFSLLVQNEDQARLVREDRLLYLSERLVQLALTRPEWEEYKDFVPRASYVVRGKRNINNEFPLATHNERHTTHLADFEDFYLAAEKRDDKMAENFLEALPEDKSKAAVLVSGGFHSAGLERTLRRLAQARGETLVFHQFTPNLSLVEVNGGSEYLSEFARAKTPLDHLFDGTKLFIPAHVLPHLGGTAAAVSLHDQMAREGSETGEKNLGDETLSMTVRRPGGEIVAMTIAGGALIAVDVFVVTQLAIHQLYPALAWGGFLAVLALNLAIFPFIRKKEPVDPGRRSFLKKLGLGLAIGLTQSFSSPLASQEPETEQEAYRLAKAREEAYQAQEAAFASALALDNRNSPFTVPGKSLLGFLTDETLQRIVPDPTLRARFLRGDFHVEMSEINNETGLIDYIYAHERVDNTARGKTDAFTNYHTGESYTANVVRINPKTGEITRDEFPNSGFPGLLPVVVAKIPINLDRPSFPSEYLKFLKVEKEHGRAYAWVHFQDRGSYPVEDVRVWTNGDLSKSNTVILPGTALLGQIAGMVSENYYSGKQNVERIHLRPQVYDDPGYLRVALRALREIWPQNALDFEAARQILRTINTSTERGRAALEILKKGWRLNTQILEAHAGPRDQAAVNAQKFFAWHLENDWDTVTTEELLKGHLQGRKHPAFDPDFVTRKDVPEYPDVRLLDAEFRSERSPPDPADEAVAAIFKGQNPKNFFDESEKEAFDMYFRERQKDRPEVVQLHKDVIKTVFKNSALGTDALAKIENPLADYGPEHPYRAASDLLRTRLGSALKGSLNPVEVAEIHLSAIGLGEEHTDAKRHRAYMNEFMKEKPDLRAATARWLEESGNGPRSLKQNLLTVGYSGYYGERNPLVTGMFRFQGNDARLSRWRLSNKLVLGMAESEKELREFEAKFGTDIVPLTVPVDRSDPYYKEYLHYMEYLDGLRAEINALKDKDGNTKEVQEKIGIFKEASSKLLYSDHETFTIAFTVGLEFPRKKFNALRDVLEEQDQPEQKSNSSLRPPKLPDMIIAAILAGLYFSLENLFPLDPTREILRAGIFDSLPGGIWGLVLSLFILLTARPQVSNWDYSRFNPHRAEPRSLLEWFTASLKGTEVNLGLGDQSRLDRALKKSRRLKENEVDMYFLGEMDERQEAVFAQAVRKDVQSVVFVNSEEDENRVRPLFNKLDAVTVIRLTQETGFNGAWVSLGRLDAYLRNTTAISPALKGALMTANGANVFQARTGPNLVALGAPKDSIFKKPGTLYLFLDQLFQITRAYTPAKIGTRIKASLMALLAA